MDGRSLETLESKHESEDLRQAAPVGKEALPWWKKTLIYCGAASLLWIAFRLFKPRLKGILTAIKTFLKTN